MVIAGVVLVLRSRTAWEEACTLARRKLPQALGIHLYIWEFNVRDSTVLGLIGVGGIGLLVSEAVSLFQWGRLATLLLAIVALVTAFDRISRRVRAELAARH